MSSGQTVKGTEKIFFPFEGELPDEFQEHYGPAASRQQIIDKVYGGLPLTELFDQITFESTLDELRRRQATITLHPTAADETEAPLILHQVSMKQFLASRLPNPSLLPFDASEEKWGDMDPQYRLEICHAEISRWSILFKREGDIQNGADISGHEPFSHIELVNNCTTTTGFEFKLVKEGHLYHGSFGEGRQLLDIYAMLSQQQAGSLPHQWDELDKDGPAFFDGYFNPLNPRMTISISLERYRGDVTRSVGELADLRINHKGIDYFRWKDDPEYYQKPLDRRLTLESKWGDGSVSTGVPPHSYYDVRTAESIAVPNFSTRGVYEIDQKKSNPYYRQLYQLESVEVFDLSDGRIDIKFTRSFDKSRYGLREVYFGNLDKSQIPIYPAYWTMHRFGFGARPTVMDYDPGFAPPGEADLLPHYGFLTGDEGRYINPEGFGVERAIFSWKAADKKILTIDIIGFERTMPVWQGEITFPG